MNILDHELRTPLHAIQGYTSLLEEDIKDTLSENAAFYIESINTAGDMLLKVVDGLFELSNLKAGNVIVDNISIDINMIIDQIEYRFNKEFSARGRILHQDYLST